MTGLLGLLSYLIFIKFESVAVLGVWSTIAIVIMLSQFVEYGLTDGLTVKIANESNLNKKEIYSINAICLFITIGIILSIFSYLLREPFFLLTNLGGYEKKSLIILYDLSCLTIIFSSILSSLRAILYGYNLHYRVNQSVFFSKIIQISVMIAFLIADFSFFSLVLSLIAYQINLFVFLIFSLNKEFKIKKNIFRNQVTIKSMCQIVNASKEMFIIKGSKKLFVDEGFKILLSRFYGSEAVGAYATAFNIVQVYQKMVETGARIMLNVRQFKNDEIKEHIKRININVILPLAVLSISGAVIFIFSVKNIDFFNDFNKVFKFFIPLVLVYSINAFATSHYYILMGKKEFGVLLNNSIFSILILYISFFIFKYILNDLFLINEIAVEVIPYCLMILSTSFYLIYKSYAVLDKR